MLEKLNKGILDAGILAVPLEMKGLDEIILYTEPFYVAANYQHRFAAQSLIKIEDLSACFCSDVREVSSSNNG